MKKITLLLTFIAVAFISNAITPVDETFTGCTVGALASQDSWTTTGTLTTGAGRTVNSTALTYSNSGGTYVLSGIGKSINVEITSCSDYKSYKTLSSGAISSGVVYVSYLYKAGTVQSQTGIEIFGLASGTSQGPRIWVGKSATSGYWKFGITRMSTTSADCAWNSGEYNNVNEVMLLVMKYDFSTSVASFYINPVIGGSEPAIPAASAPNTPITSGEGLTGGRSSLNNLWFRSTGSSAYKYNIGNIRVSTSWADAVASQVAVSPLTSPVVGSASSVSTNGFTANWTPVANAVGYDVKVYLGANLISTTNASGQATGSLAVSGLMPGLTYSYKVIAKGDMTNFSDSDPSTASTSFTTSDPFASNALNTDFGDISWGEAVTSQPTAGTYPSATINGFDLSSAVLYAGTIKGIKGETHTNRIAIDKNTYSGKVTFPTVNSLEQLEIHATAGTAGNGFQLKEFNAATNTWSAIGGTYVYDANSKAAGTDSIYIIPISRSIPTKFRVENPTNGGIYLLQVITRTTNPTLLSKPLINAATEISSTGFTANWTAVENATSYKVLVYQGSTLTGTFNVSGQSTQSAIISGLTPNAAYTYRVQAVGDNYINFSDSFLSVASALTTSNSFNISGTKSLSGLSTLNTSSSVEISNGSTLNIDAVKTINNITLNPGATMNVTALNPLTVSTLTLKSDKDDTSFSVKLDDGITATNVNFLKTIDDTKWYFMSFPCDVNVSSITKSNGNPMGTIGIDWFIKYYDGNKRANDGVSNGSNWVSVTGGTLTAKQGYIFGLKTGTPETELLIPLTTEILNVESESSIPVMSHNSGLAAEVHKGWNLIGQPYLSRFAAQTGSDVPFMVVPNADGKTYSVKSKAIGTLPEINPMSAYFVQTGTDGNITFGLTGRQSVRSLVEKNTVDYLQLKISNNEGIDETYLILDDHQSTAYQIGQDMEKWVSSNSDRPQIYSTLNNVKYAFNALPENSVNNLKIGTYTKISGSTTISADASRTLGISNLLLTDNNTGFVTDLLTSDYHFTASEGIDENRLTLTIKKISTEIKAGFETNGPVFTISNGRILIDNLSDLKSVQVYDAVGHLLTNINAVQNTIELPTLVKGIYTIKIQTNNKTWTKKMMI